MPPELSDLHVDGPTFPPTRTLTWLRCPRLADYETRWGGREWTPNLLAGKVIHQAMAWWLRSGAAEFTQYDWARAELELGWPASEDGREACWNLVKAGITVATAQEELLEGIRGSLVGVEVCLDHTDTPHTPVPGSCAIADMVHRPYGWLSITDHKTKLSLDAKWIPKQLRDTETSWQLFDYARRATLLYGEWVKEVRQNLIVCSPKPKAVLETVFISPERLIHWTRSAETVWARMQEDAELAWAGRDGKRAGCPDAYPMNWTSCWDFTRNDDGAAPGCPMFDGCHRLLGDESKFGNLYAKRGSP